MSEFRLAVVLGALIHTERNARGMTQHQLAAFGGLHPMALSKIERGIQLDIGVETLQRIAVALSTCGSAVSASELLANAERWRADLEARRLAGQLPAPASPPAPLGNGTAVVLTGAALAAVVLLLASAKK